MVRRPRRCKNDRLRCGLYENIDHIEGLIERRTEHLHNELEVRLKRKPANREKRCRCLLPLEGWMLPMTWTDESAGSTARHGSGLGLPAARGFRSYWESCVAVAAGSQPAQASDCQATTST